MRVISYTVGVDSISPSTVQFAGFAGEDNATTLQFSFDDKLADVIAGYSVVHYLLEVRDSSGVYNAYPLQLVTLDGEPPLSFEVPKDITLLSGKVILQLSIVKLDGDNNQERKLFTYPVRLRFSSSASGGVSGSSEYEQYRAGVVSAMVRAEDAARKVEGYAEEAAKANDAADRAAESEVAARDYAMAAETAQEDAVAAKNIATAAATAAKESEDKAAEAASKAAETKQDIDKIIDQKVEASVDEKLSAVAEDIRDKSDAATAACENAETAASRAEEAKAIAVDAISVYSDAVDRAADLKESMISLAEATIANSEAAIAAANRAEAAAAEESWIHLKTVTLDAAKYDPNEKTEDMGDTTKGLRVKVTLPANTALPNNRLIAYISLNNSRQIVVRAEGWTKDESNPTVCIYEVRPFADVWNAETAPYFKTIASVTGDVTRKQGDLVRYFKLMTNVDNPLPVGTKMEFWGLE